jgi:predicted amidohydrolase
MVLGYLQYAPILADAESNETRLETLLRENLERSRVDLLVLPELCNSGYNFGSKEIAFRTAEHIADSSFIRLLTSICARYDSFIVSGFNEREGEFCYNSSLLIGPSGCLGVYRKLHLFLNEQDYFQPGNLGLPLFDLGFCKLGMLICFDWVFPEVWRVLALKGADVICHPSNLILPGCCQMAVPVHSLVNRVFVATANRIGTEGELQFTGGSLISDPRGNVLASATATETVLGASGIDVTLARNKQITARNHLFADRRTAEYTALIDPERVG